MLGTIIGVLINALGIILINIIYVLLVVAQYNTFINSTAVSTGWVIMRDICNMFFVLALLVIAVGTILQQEQYSYKKLLPNFIIMAIMVNFSKTICGVIIDFANVIMATFVAALAQSGGGGFAALLGIPQLMKLSQSGTLDFGTSTVGLFTALLFMGVALIVMTTAVASLVFRIIALWFLIVLSPLAFTASILPEGQAHWNRWWKEFSSNVIMGPVLAFFLWLSLAVVSKAADGAGGNAENINIAREFGAGLNFQEANTGITGVFTGASGNALQGSAGYLTNTAGSLAGYILGIGMLIGSLVAASEIGGAGGKIASKGSGYAADWLKGKKGISFQRTFRGRTEKTYQKAKAYTQAFAKQQLGGLAIGAQNLAGRAGGAVGGARGARIAGMVAGTASALGTGYTRAELLEMKKSGKGYIQGERQKAIELEKGEIKSLKAGEIRAQLAAGGMTANKKAAMIQQLTEKGRLMDASDAGNDAGIMKALGETRTHLKGSEAGDKLDEGIKAKNIQAAFQPGSIYTKKDKATGADVVDNDKVIADLAEGKIKGHQFEKLNGTQIGQMKFDAATGENTEFLAKLTAEIGDPKEAEKVLESMGKKVLQNFSSTLMDANTAAATPNAAINNLNDSQREAIAHATGSYDIIDNAKLTAGIKGSKDFQKKFFEKANERTLKNVGIIENVINNKLGPTDDHIKNMTDVQKAAMQESTQNIVINANTGPGTFTSEANAARILQVKLSGDIGHTPAGGAKTSVLPTSNIGELDKAMKKMKPENLKKFDPATMLNAAEKEIILNSIARNWSVGNIAKLYDDGNQALAMEIIGEMKKKLRTTVTGSQLHTQYTNMIKQMGKDRTLAGVV